MAPDFTTFTWREALAEFLLHLQATRADKTRRFYDVQLRQLIGWAEAGDVPFTQFGKRHMDRYLAERSKTVAPTTLRHDAVAAKSFFRWCQKNDLIERSLLADYEIRRAPTPARYMPTDEEIRGLLGAIKDYWDPSKNPPVRYNAPLKRIFHRERNAATILGLLDSACRIGEMLHLKVDDYRPVERQITIREGKGREPRTLPVSASWAEALSTWLRLRARVMADVPPAEDAGWLFVSEYGGMVDQLRFLKAVKRYLAFAGLTDKITLHSLRRYSLNKLAKVNLLATQQIAGHKDARTTLLYTKLDADFMRDVHESVGVVRDLLTSKRIIEKRKRLL